MSDVVFLGLFQQLKEIMGCSSFVLAVAAAISSSFLSEIFGHINSECIEKYSIR